jgi:hypothetical protein
MLVVEVLLQHGHFAAVTDANGNKFCIECFSSSHISFGAELIGLLSLSRASLGVVYLNNRLLLKFMNLFAFYFTWHLIRLKKIVILLATGFQLPFFKCI